MDNIKWILSNIKPNVFMYIMTIFLIILESGTYIYSIRIQQNIIDTVIIHGQTNELLGLLIIILVCYITFSILYVINPLLQNKIFGSIKMKLILKSTLYFHNLPIEIQQKNKSGNYVHHLTNEIPLVSKLIGFDSLDAIKHLTTLVVVSTIIIQINSWMFIVIIVFSAFYFLSGKKFSKQRMTLQKEIQTNKSSLVSFFEEAISSTRDVISTNNEQWLISRYSKVFLKYYKSVLWDGKILGRQILTQEFFSTCAFLLILGLGGYFIFVGEITIGMLVVIYQLTSELISAFQNSCNVIINMVSMTTIIEKVKNHLEIKTVNKRDRTIQGKIGVLSLNRVVFKHDTMKEPILNHLTLNFPLGKKIALVGTSGSGKSTIANLLVRFFEPQGGEIKVNGINLNQLSKKDWINRVSIVLQDPYLFSETIRSNILLGRECTDYQLTEICKLACIHEFISSLPLKYDTILSERGMTLSGGQKQRIAIARALIRDSEILILDEATSALDLDTEKKIQSNIDKQRSGKTTIVIAHRLSTVKNADVIIVLKNGRVIETGQHNELVSRNTYYKKLIETEYSA
ncbi:ABC transporter ATP-binding protein [Psychrobacillus sp. FSL H8-0510]|uniref:ABC transporter ATP-binding protein n=1 Tax=Psychrobacillus sp. FSL H8-0510 TaxID=2921394 RepID=UPI0030F4C2CE